MEEKKRSSQIHATETRSGIYIIESKVNSKIIVGSTNCFYRRYQEHFSELRKSKHYNSKLQRAFNKYGEENFVFRIHEVCEESRLLEREQYYLDTLLFAQEYIRGEDSRFEDLGFNIQPLAGSTINETIPVVKVSFDGEILKSYPSLKSAAIDTFGIESYYKEDGRVSDSGIGAVVSNNQYSAGGYYWFPYISNSLLRESIEKRLLEKPYIEKIDLKTGECLSKYRRVSDIERELGLNVGNTVLSDVKNSFEKIYKDNLYRLSSYVSETKYILSIDIGKTGALCLLKEDMSKIYNFASPVISDQIDVNRIRDFISTWRRHISICIFEDVHSIHGASAKSNFQFGRALGIIEGVVHTFELPHIKVQPKTWQKYCFRGIPEIRKNVTSTSKGTIDTKAMALIAANRLFPNETFLATSRSRVPHDGIVDATLIAYYLKNNR